MLGDSMRAMKYRAIFLLLVCCYAVHAYAQELPLLGKLPQLGREWVLQKQGWFPQKQETNKKGAYEGSWATFTNSKTGDIMSFAADRSPNIKSAVGNSAVRQASIDMFPGGLPRFMLNGPAGWRVIELRGSVITLGTGRISATQKNVDVEALEYSLVYESEAASTPNRLGHGYVLAFGDTVIFVQHTSTHVITFEDAMAAAESVLRIHLGLKR